MNSVECPNVGCDAFSKKQHDDIFGTSTEDDFGTPRGNGIKFHYHPSCADMNGNNGPLPNDPGWIEFNVPGAKDAFDYDAAFNALPRNVQKKIQETMNSEGYDSLQQLIDATGGDGFDFTLAGEDSEGNGFWADLLDIEEELERDH
jgi:hypothetical protein